MYTELLQNVIYISTQLVVLQTLRAGYKFELECDNKQEIKNFRSNAILTSINIILDDLNPFMVYLFQCQDGSIKVPRDQLEHIRSLILDMSEFYSWVTQEVKIKKQRIDLMKLEAGWLSDSSSDV
jgi:hypothetical protein